jgi:hypothetical protein
MEAWMSSIAFDFPRAAFIACSADSAGPNGQFSLLWKTIAGLVGRRGGGCFARKDLALLHFQLYGCRGPKLISVRCG